MKKEDRTVLAQCALSPMNLSDGNPMHAFHPPHSERHSSIRAEYGAPAQTMLVRDAG